MSLLFNKLNLTPFFHPEPVVQETKTPLTKDETIKFLSSDDEEEKEETIELDDKKEKKEKKEKEEVEEENEDESGEETEDGEEDENEDEDDEEEDELAELEDELEIDDEKLELTNPISRREILKKYPKIFKEFPQLETSYYREMEFTKVFPTIPEAREAAEKAATLDNFERDLLEGNTEKMLSGVKSLKNQNSFNKMVDGYMDTLRKVDANAHQHVVGNIIKNVILHMVNKGRSSKNEDLITVAEELNKFVFGSDEFEPPKKLASEDKKDENEVERQKREYAEERFNDASTKFNTKITNIFKSTIAANIDKNGDMSDFVKRAAVAQCMDRLQELLNRDKRLKTITDKLWENAIKNGYDSPSMDKLKRAFTSSASPVLPTLMKKARAEALKGISRKKVETKNNNEDDNDEQENQTKEKPVSRNSGKKSDKSVPAGMSTLDFLMQD